MRELIEKRKIRSKTYLLEDGRKKVVCRPTPMHFVKDDVLVDYDLTPQKEGKKWVIPSAQYELEIHEDGTFILSFNGEEYKVSPGFSIDISDVECSERHLTINEAIPNVDLILHIGHTKIEWFKRIKSPDVDTRFEWDIEQEENSKFIVKKDDEAIGWDAHGNKLKFGFDTLTERKEKNKIKRRIKEQAPNQMLRPHFTTRVLEDTPLSKMKYPILLDVPDVSVSVEHSLDTVYVKFDFFDSTTVHIGGSVIRAGGYYGNYGEQDHPFFRFRSVGVSQGASISLAELKLGQKRSPFASAAPTGITWFGIDEADTPASNVGTKPFLRPRTTATGDFNTSASSSYVTNAHDVTDIVQEIVDLGSFDTDSPIAFLGVVTGTDTGGSVRSSHFAEYGQMGVIDPTLEITLGGGPDPVSGTSSWTESDDTSSASGALELTGTSSWSEGADAASGSGTLIYTGSISYTESDDSASASGTLIITGSLSSTEQDDSAAGSGLLELTGTSSWSEGADTCTASGNHIEAIAGASSWTEAGDSMSSAAAEEMTGASSWTEEQDYLSSTGTEEMTGPAAWTEALDQLVAEGKLVYSGSGAWTEDGDTIDAAGISENTGTGAWSENADTCGASGSVTPPAVSGTSSWNEADDSCVAAGQFGNIVQAAERTLYARTNADRTLYANTNKDRDLHVKTNADRDIYTG